MASANKADVNFSMMFQGAHLLYKSGAYYSAFLARAKTYTQDSGYQKINGIPVIFFFDTTTLTTANWTEFKSVFGNPGVGFYGVMLDGNTSEATRLGLQAVGQYGPRNLPVGSGRQPFSAQAAADQAKWTIGGFQKVCTVTPMQDRRTFLSSTVFVDLPTTDQWLSLLMTATDQTGCKTVIVYAWSEICEGGPGIVPTTQEGTRFLDVIDWVRNSNFPSTYTEKVGAETSGVITTGGSGWSYRFPDPSGIQGAHQGDEVISSTAGDYKMITVPECHSVEIWATKGPDRGKADIDTDGSFNQTVDLYNAVEQVSVLVATLNFGVVATHTVKFRVRGDKNGASSSVQCGIDYFKPVREP